MTDAEIVELANMVLAIDQSPDDAALAQRFEDRFERLEPVEEGPLVMLASKLLGGKPYRVISDNPETLRRCRSLAAHLGAAVTEETDMVIRPAITQPGDTT
jgi:hypothetical protein